MRVEVTRVAPGRPFLAAVEIATDPHWHVYWRNPGDSGVPTRIAWSAPKGWRVEPLEFPIPRRFAPGGVAAYGYEGKTFFLARITPSTTPGGIAAKASWLVCSEACVQGGATVGARVPLGAVKPGPYAKALRSAHLALPRPGAGRLRARTGKGVTLEATFASPASWWKRAEFFPSESGAVDQAKPILATLQGGKIVFKMERSPFPEQRSQLKGLIVFASGPRRQAVQVETKLEKE